MAGTGLTPAPPLRAGLSFSSNPTERSVLVVWNCGSVCAAVPLSKDADRGASKVIASSDAAASSRGLAAHTPAKPRSGDIAGRTA